MEHEKPLKKIYRFDIVLREIDRLIFALEAFGSRTVYNLVNAFDHLQTDDRAITIEESGKTQDSSFSRKTGNRHDG